MKKAFATGLVILLPIAITAYIVMWIVDFFTEPFTHFVKQIFISYSGGRGHELLIAFISRVVILIILAFLILLLGLLARRFFFNRLLALSERIFAKIPVVKTIYNILSEATKAMLKPGEKAFKETVLIPFPNKDTHALGFVTGQVPEGLNKVLGENNLSVFVPTAPHPISGYLLFAPPRELIKVPITTEETFTFLISCGMTHPKPKD
jgi:uncharacterized membrane protein